MLNIFFACKNEDRETTFASRSFAIAGPASRHLRECCCRRQCDALLDELDELEELDELDELEELEELDELLELDVVPPEQMWLRLSHFPSAGVVAPRSVSWPVTTLKCRVPPVFFVEGIVIGPAVWKTAVMVEDDAAVWTRTKCHRTWPELRPASEHSSPDPLKLGSFQLIGGV